MTSIVGEDCFGSEDDGALLEEPVFEVLRVMMKNKKRRGEPSKLFAAYIGIKNDNSIILLMRNDGLDETSWKLQPGHTI